MAQLAGYWSEGEESFQGSLLDEESQPRSRSPQATDFLGGRGFNTSFFGSLSPRPPAALATVAGQLRVLQDQLHNEAAFDDDLGTGSPGEMDDAWEDEDEVVNEVLADLDARMGLQPGPPGMFGPSENLTRLLTRMLGLGAGVGGTGLVGGFGSRSGGSGDDDGSHRLHMLDLGFPTALDPDRHAALAAEGVPAGRMLGVAEGERERGSSSSVPAISRLLGLMDFRLAESMPPQLASGMQRAFAAGRRQPVPQQRAALWEGDMPSLESEGEEETDSEGDMPYLSDEDGPPMPRRLALVQQRSHQGSTAAAGAGAVVGAAAAGRQGYDDDEMPDLVEEESSSSGFDSESPRRRWPRRPPSGQARRPAVVGAVARAPAESDSPPTLVSDEEENSMSSSSAEREEDDDDLPALMAAFPGWGFGGGGAAQRQRMAVRRPAGQAQRGVGGAVAAQGAAQRTQQPQPLPPHRRERRHAIFGQLPGLAGRQLPVEDFDDDMPSMLDSDDSDADRRDHGGGRASLGSPPGFTSESNSGSDGDVPSLYGDSNEEEQLGQDSTLHLAEASSQLAEHISAAAVLVGVGLGVGGAGPAQPPEGEDGVGSAQQQPAAAAPGLVSDTEHAGSSSPALAEQSQSQDDAASSTWPAAAAGQDGAGTEDGADPEEVVEAALSLAHITGKQRGVQAFAQLSGGEVHAN